MRILEWKSLSAPERRSALDRPAQRNADSVALEARRIIDAVRLDGDAALYELTQRFDAVRLDHLAVAEREFSQAEHTLSAAQHAALDAAIAAVHRFHSAQAPAAVRVETAPGVLCERISVPVRAVG